MSQKAIIRALVVTLAVLVGIVAALVAGIVARVGGASSVVSLRQGGVTFVGAVTVAILILSALGAV